MSQNRPISDALASSKTLISVEFFPPKDEAGGAQILDTALTLKEEVAPDFVSITYGAGGTTRERTFRYARILKDTYGFNVMPHLTCVGASAEELTAIARDYVDAGFCNFMALRGDPPKGATDFQPHPEGLRHGSDLVALLRGTFPGLSLGVAGYPEVHPEAISPADDLKFLKVKVDAGASFITTQLFYDNATYLEWARAVRAAGITVPVIPGLMPVFSANAARRFAKVIPAELEAALEAAGDDRDAVEAVGIDWACGQIRELIAAGAPGVHLYIMNRSRMATTLVGRLRADGIL